MTEKHGAIIVAVTRLVPLFPFNLLNYGFGLTRVPFWTYLFWSWLCMLPGTIAYLVGTDAVILAVTTGELPGPPWGCSPLRWPSGSGRAVREGKAQGMKEGDPCCSQAI